MTNPGGRLVARGFRTRAVMIAGGLDLGLIGLVVARIGNRPTGAAMAFLGVAAALYASLKFLASDNLA
ncbi:MAG: hypothetical protein Q8P31_03375 [Bacillota bacterium]|nr:hypothetical protein [Bacillota bacterium]